MKLTNQQIEQYFTNYNNAFVEFKSYIPVRANFIINKNINKLQTLTQEITDSRLQIAQHYGTMNEEGTAYLVPEDKQAAAAQELQSLYSLEQEVDIAKITLDALGNAEFTPMQMSALMFMIEEDE